MTEAPKETSPRSPERTTDNTPPAIKFDEEAAKGEIVIVKDGTKVILEGPPGSGTATLTQGLNKQVFNAKFRILSCFQGGVIAVGIKTLKAANPDGVKTFSRNYFWRYKATHAEVRSAID